MRKIFLFLSERRSWTYVHEGSIDVVATLPIDGDEERQAAVWGQDVHAPVFLMVPGQKRDATIFHTQRRRDHVQGLCEKTQTYGEEIAGENIVSSLDFSRFTFPKADYKMVLSPIFPLSLFTELYFYFSPWILTTDSAHQT